MILELIGTMKAFTGFTFVNVVFLVAACILVGSNHAVGRQARRAFLAVLIALVCIVVADWFMHLTNGAFPELRMVHTALMAATFMVAPGLTVVIAFIIFPDRSVKWMMALVVVHAVFQLVNIAGGFVFYIDEANAYHRGPLYGVYMAAYSITSLYLVVESIRAGRVYQNVSIVAIFGILACMVAGVFTQVVDSSVRTTWLAVSMAVVLYFLFYADMVVRTDPLTKLLNRRSYEDALVKPPLPCVAVVIDIDDFKHVNDTFGHAYGDECLARVGGAIRRVFGGAGLCYRTGGDEFAVIMTKRLDEIDKLVAELQQIASTVRQSDKRLPGVSVGYASADRDCTNIEAVFARADQNMYEAKRRSKES